MLPQSMPWGYTTVAGAGLQSPPWEEGGCTLPACPALASPDALSSHAHLCLPWAPQTLNNLFPLLLLPHDKAPGMQRGG